MSQELETSAAQGLETGVYVISSIAFPGGSIGVEKSGPRASGITPRNVVSWPASPDPEVVQVKNLGGGRYNLISGGLGTSPKSKKLVGVVFPPTSGETWGLEYKSEYDGYT
ncbi:hypothetical protein SERLA73DRAFT_151197 [Serpula lacrymans var. lacrymans S7.3]|uniref:Uncharacterized protein n=1 Tax=Serpula lacrymans var. lacrymans (strain S7.3) TaxID=936435 RepID=F8PQT4_SERL3|nr:hypothetical protein SERLA73DRAFT_151197 [Serpula lacrymans var. lacrymans S7.3]